MREIKFNSFDTETKTMHYNVGFDNTCKNGENNVIFLEYTGLKDIHGKEIYEGDLIREIPSEFPDPTIYECMFNPRKAQFGFYGYHLKAIITNFPVESISEYYEVIGNRFETPELIS